MEEGIVRGDIVREEGESGIYRTVRNDMNRVVREQRTKVTCQYTARVIRCSNGPQSPKG